MQNEGRTHFPLLLMSPQRPSGEGFPCRVVPPHLPAAGCATHAARKAAITRHWKNVSSCFLLHVELTNRMTSALRQKESRKQVVNQLTLHIFDTKTCRKTVIPIIEKCIAYPPGSCIYEMGITFM
ncbi:hypothetical protein TNIN_256091 [Trichonephila inaurata madagascariensis]|uniref:Uncharacterized protein n=1 Tax=Trichonephila inaurata madagascariensis TaxID=2747483 RepID=A0A8X6J0F9_9ARAC|nr:hypothetical protein TNIN_256091 [Trichonephila inaurata madagascariensis]